MHQDNKILISAILILGVAMLSFSFGGLSGRVSAGNVACKSVSVQAVKEGVWINMRIDIPPNAPGTSYNGVKDSEVIIRRSSGEKVADVRIPKDVFYSGNNPMIFRINTPIESGWAGVRDMCTNNEIRDSF